MSRIKVDATTYWQVYHQAVRNYIADGHTRDQAILKATSDMYRSFICDEAQLQLEYEKDLLDERHSDFTR